MQARLSEEDKKVRSMMPVASPRTVVPPKAWTPTAESLHLTAKLSIRQEFLLHFERLHMPAIIIACWCFET